jgi:hypothetical protein
VQTDILDRGPDDHQAAGLGREHVNLVAALSHIAKETFDGVRRLNVTMHHLASTHKTSTHALRPQPDRGPLPR